MLSLSLVSFSLRVLSTVYVVAWLCWWLSLLFPIVHCTQSAAVCECVRACSIAELSNFNPFDFTIAIQSDESNAFRVQPLTFPDVRVAEPTQSCVSVASIPYSARVSRSVSLRLPVPTFAPPSSSTSQTPIVWLRLTANDMLTLFSVIPSFGSSPFAWDCSHRFCLSLVLCVCVRALLNDYLTQKKRERTHNDDKQHTIHWTETELSLSRMYI